MTAWTNKWGEKRCFFQLFFALGIVSLISSCATTEPTVRQQDLDAWVGVSVEAIDTHVFFNKEVMFRTMTTSGTEIRNYAYGYNFLECFGRAGATRSGDFVDDKAFIICSSGRIVCNNLFYIRDGIVLEYAPTGRCTTDEKIRPDVRFLRPKRQEPQTRLDCHFLPSEFANHF